MTMTPGIEVPPSPCLGCGEIADMVSAVAGNRNPQAGDLTICIYCGHIMIFADDLMLRDPTDFELRLIAGDRRILAVQKARRRMKS